MQGAFEWLGQLVAWFGQWVPRWMVLNPTEGAIKFVTLRLRDLVRCRWDTSIKSEVVGPGLVFYWPAVTELKLWVVARQPVNLTTQTITTKDGKVVAIGAVMVFRVVDVIPLIADTFDPDATIRAIAAGAVQRVCGAADWDELQRAKDDGTLDRHLKRALRKALRRRYGVHVIDATLTDFAPCRVLKIITSTSSDT